MRNEPLIPTNDARVHSRKCLDNRWAEGEICFWRYIIPGPTLDTSCIASYYCSTTLSRTREPQLVVGIVARGMSNAISSTPVLL